MGRDGACSTSDARNARKEEESIELISKSMGKSMSKSVFDGHNDRSGRVGLTLSASFRLFPASIRLPIYLLFVFSGMGAWEIPLITPTTVRWEATPV